MAPTDRETAETTVEFYAGGKADEAPRAIVRGGRRIEIARILAHERVQEAATGSRREVWRVLLADGRTAKIDLLEGGARRVAGLD